MPIVVDTATVTFYAQTLRIGPRASIVFTEEPSKKLFTGLPLTTDGVNIIVDSLDLTRSPLHPLVFVTRQSGWLPTSNRLVTVVSNEVRLRAGTQAPPDMKILARDLSLDENYASFTSSTDQLKAYSVEIGTPAARQQFQEYLVKTMLWPLETAEKIARQFSNAPFDTGNTKFLQSQIASLYAVLPSGSHPVARTVLTRTSHAIDAKVDNLGFYQYYVPRISFLQTLNEFVLLQTSTLTLLEAWDKEIVAAQKGTELTGVLQSLDSDAGGLKAKAIDAAVRKKCSIITVNKDFLDYYRDHPMRKGKWGKYRLWPHLPEAQQAADPRRAASKRHSRSGVERHSRSRRSGLGFSGWKNPAGASLSRGVREGVAEGPDGVRTERSQPFNARTRRHYTRPRSCLLARSGPCLGCKEAGCAGRWSHLHQLKASSRHPSVGTVSHGLLLYKRDESKHRAAQEAEWIRHFGINKVCTASAGGTAAEEIYSAPA